MNEYKNERKEITLNIRALLADQISSTDIVEFFYQTNNKRCSKFFFAHIVNLLAISIFYFKK